MGLAEKTFLDKSDKNYFDHKSKVNLVLNSKVKPYTLNIQHLKQNYNSCYVQSIEEFAMNYCYAYFMLRPKLDSKVNREAMFIEILAYFKQQIYTAR